MLNKPGALKSEYGPCGQRSKFQVLVINFQGAQGIIFAEWAYDIVTFRSRYPEGSEQNRCLAASYKLRNIRLSIERKSSWQPAS